jgi:hypothetical protein
MDIDGRIELLQLALVGLEVVGGIIAEIDSTGSIVGELVRRRSTNADCAIATWTRELAGFSSQGVD